MVELKRNRVEEQTADSTAAHDADQEAVSLADQEAVSLAGQEVVSLADQEAVSLAGQEAVSLAGQEAVSLADRRRSWPGDVGNVYAELQSFFSSKILSGVQSPLPCIGPEAGRVLEDGSGGLRRNRGFLVYGDL
ncbi:hypothetical protein EYF80_054694 [Liparis tanakae]|uniref:Uncharacterized protein n=1 Tax=Liparis tanakae TaxID=230148 RepID=A0A4Z2F2J9_9TELE|nr:hypothetical protein EYF80_054694 [Liparis tanakae]